MSTFNGLVAEFPDIRIDFFRSHPDAPPPLACFLSHVHSDHLAGLESLRSPFVYCSAATREILLRLERYPCRINYAKGILEARQQTYRHLHKVLKPLHLGTPTCLELRPNCQIQVTLLDANHCPGAVMFLIEGDGKAVLYTGDVRSEPWFVNCIARNPNLVAYTSGIRQLDKIYLDTSFIQDVPFQTKAEGIAELLRKVSRYPPDTIFHMQAWTYGYEDVWIALSRALKSPIHVDDYKIKIYKSLRVRASDDRFGSCMHLTPESPALVGYMCGNAQHPGCLTSDPDVRLHSCEKGNLCTLAKGASVVHIHPIIAHLSSGEDLAEVGVGGGGDDLEREAELDLLAHEDLANLFDSIWAFEDLDATIQEQIRSFLTHLAGSGRNLSLDLDISSLDDSKAANLEHVIRAIANKTNASKPRVPLRQNECGAQKLPRIIRFPYSRHSSYQELCHLVSVFKPRDVWPCTVDPTEWLREGVTIRDLFGRHCSGTAHEHDIKMDEMREARMAAESKERHRHHLDSQLTTDSQPRPDSSPLISFLASSSQSGQPPPPPSDQMQSATSNHNNDPERSAEANATTGEASTPRAMDVDVSSSTNRESHTPRRIASNGAGGSTGSKRRFDDYAGEADEQSGGGEENGENGDSQSTTKSFASTLSMRHSLTRREAYYRMLEDHGGDWSPVGLISTDGHHTEVEKEL